MKICDGNNVCLNRRRPPIKFSSKNVHAHIIIIIDERICNKFVIIIVFNSYELLLLFIILYLRRWHTMRNRLDSDTRLCARPPPRRRCKNLPENKSRSQTRERDE